MPSHAKTARPVAPKPAPAPVRRTTPTSVTGKTPGALTVQTSVPSGAPTGDVAPGVMELKGHPDFTPPMPIASFLDARKNSRVNVRYGKWAEGPISVSTISKGKYRVQRQPIPLSHPMLARVAEVAPGLAPSLVLNVANNKLTGHVGLAAGAKVEDLRKHIAQAPALLGLVGFSISSLPSIINTIEGGSLHLGLKGVPIRLGAAFNGTFSFEVIDDAITFEGNAAHWQHLKLQRESE